MSRKSHNCMDFGSYGIFLCTQNAKRQAFWCMIPTTLVDVGKVTTGNLCALRL